MKKMQKGLDIITTSPGHGTAFNIAGKNIADETDGGGDTGVL